MKVSVIAFAATMVTAVSAVSLKRAADMDPRDAAAAPGMEFTGPVVVGGPNVTLQGTAKEIYKQVLALNPNYDPWDFPDYRERMGVRKDAKPTAEELAAHGAVVKKRDGLTCTPSGDPVWAENCREGIRYLYGLNGYCGAPRGWAGEARVSCSWNCGIFLYNDNDYPINIWCGNLAGDAEEILRQCALGWVKGQVFRDGPPAWNTVVKWQNC